jgi:hypothetical protein
MSNFMTVAERVVYKICPTNPSQTVAVKEAWVESRFYGLRSAIKNFGIERFKNNAVKVIKLSANICKPQIKFGISVADSGCLILDPNIFSSFYPRYPFLRILHKKMDTKLIKLILPFSCSILSQELV